MSNFYDMLGRSLAKEDLKNTFGWHLLIDIRGADDSTLNSADTIKAFLKIMVDRLEMIPVGDAEVRLFNDANGRGVSGLQLLTTSHISAHCSSDKTRSAYIDIFSCNKYSSKLKKTSLQTVKEFFNPKEIYHIIVMRLPNKITDEIGNPRLEDIR